MRLARKIISEDIVKPKNSGPDPMYWVETRSRGMDDPAMQRLGLLEKERERLHNMNVAMQKAKAGLQIVGNHFGEMQGEELPESQ